jgi:hypothetical protein
MSTYDPSSFETFYNVKYLTQATVDLQLCNFEWASSDTLDALTAPTEGFTEDYYSTSTIDDWRIDQTNYPLLRL